MAITTQVNNNLYKRALSEAEKERLAQIAKTQGAGAASSAYLASQNATQGATVTPTVTPGTGGATVTATGDAAAARERAQAAQAQMQAAQERSRIMSSGDTKAINEYLQKEAQQRAIEQAAKSGNTQAAAQMQQAADAQERARILSSGNQQQINQYLIEQSRQQAGQNAYQKAVASATPKPTSSGLANAPTINGNYIWYGWMGNNDMTTMNDEEKADWQTAMQGWKNGDYKSYNDNFQTAGKWASYVDDKGNVNGMLRYIGDGIGGYVPVNEGQLLQSGFSGNLGDYAFYGPDGSVYTADANGRLTKAGTWTADYDQVMKNGYYYSNPDRYFVGKDGKYYTYGDVPDDKLAEWGYVRKYDGLWYEPETIAREQALKNGDITPEQLAMEQAMKTARNAGNVPSGGNTPSGGGSSGNYTRTETKTTTPTPTPSPTPSGGTYTQPTGGSVTPPGTTPAPTQQPASTNWQAYLDQYDYGTAPAWDGTEYEQKRDAALEAAGQPWEPSEYQSLRDEALRSAGEPWQGSEYQPKRDAALERAENMRWNYDPNNDPVWQALQKQYRREGQRATQDALGQAAARTGGVPSSYAVTAASQAGDYYAAQLADRIPQVYQDSYNRYLQEIQRQLGISDQYAQFDNTEYSRWADQQNRNLQQADRYHDYDQTAYGRYVDNYQKKLAEADRYQSYGAQEYDRYRDRLGQWNTDRAFRYGLNRDAVEDARYADETAYTRAWNEENRDYTRQYQQWRDSVSDQRYDQEWAQQLREYADAQGWKQAEWQQYLREYGDQLSEKERQWAYQMARDAVSDQRYADETAYNRSAYADETAYERAIRAEDTDYDRYRDSVSDERWERQYADEQEQTEIDRAWKRVQTTGIISEADAAILGIPAGNYSGSAYTGGGSGRSSGGSKTVSETTTPSSGQYDESGRRTGTWQDADGYTYVGYHSGGQWKSQGYDAAWASVQALAQSGASKETVLTRIRSLVTQNRITDYEAEMMLVNLGYRGSSAGTGRNTIGPNNVQMVQ